MLELHITGRAGVPDTATVSNLNTTPGGTVPNAVITKIGTGGNVCIYTNNATHIIADINGYYPAG